MSLSGSGLLKMLLVYTFLKQHFSVEFIMLLPFSGFFQLLHTYYTKHIIKQYVYYIICVCARARVCFQ